MSSFPGNPPNSQAQYRPLRIVKAGALYFLITLGAGFVLEVIRLQVVGLYVSERVAEMMEIPTTLLATIIGARWVIDRFTLPPFPSVRLSVGFVALGLMLMMEWMVVLPLHHLSWDDYVASQDPVVGMLPLGALGVLTVMPFLVGYRWER